MNCCDEYGNCNQGRNCPIRQERIARVAKIGRKEHGREALRGSPWRRQLRYLAGAMLACLAVMLVSAAVVGIMTRT